MTTFKLRSAVETLLWSETYSAPEGTPPATFRGEAVNDGDALDSFMLETDITQEVARKLYDDLEGFDDYCIDTLGFSPYLEFDVGQVSHDFVLSRNGHGAGFFDGDYTLRPDEMDDETRALLKKAGATFDAEGACDVSKVLQAAAKTFGAFNLMVWFDESGTLCMEATS